MNSRHLVFCIAWSAFAGSALCAQDPFDDPLADASDAATTGKGGKGSPATDGARTRASALERDAVVRSLRANPPSTPIELAKAVQLMARIQRWDEVALWLDELARVPLDPSTAVAVLQGAGSKTWLDIEKNANRFNQQQLATVAKILRSADDTIHSAATLGESIKLLQSTSQADRLSGFQSIKAAGNSGITAILNAVMGEKGVVPNPSMVEAYSLLGSRATRAWQAAMTSVHDDSRNRLVQLVARAPKPDMGCELLAALHDPAISEENKNAIKQSLLDRAQAIPAAVQVYRYCLTQVDKSIASYRNHLVLAELDTETGWGLMRDGRTVQEQNATPAQLYLDRASQAAIASLRLTAASDVASAKAVAAHLEASARRGEVDMTGNVAFQKILPESLRDSHEFACLVADAAKAEQLIGAQSIATANLTRWAGPLIPVAVRDRLVANTKSGHPFVRYTAATALMNTILALEDEKTAGQPQAGGEPSDAGRNSVMVEKSTPSGASWYGFDGRSRIDTVGLEMQQLSAEPLVLIIGGSSSLRSHVHGLVDQLGYQYMEASSVHDVFAALRASVPVELIVIVDHVRDSDLGQLIQRIRSNPSTLTVPIALLADSLSRGEHSVAAADHRVVMGGVPPEAEGLGDVLRQIDSFEDMPRAETEQRIVWRESAINYFKRMHPESLQKGGNTFVSLTASSREEQQNLLRIIAEAEESTAKREQASRIFVQSVRRFGLLITTEMANAQYDVYNARGEIEPVTRAVLGRVLDAIEASNGQKSWSDVAP